MTIAIKEQAIWAAIEAIYNTEETIVATDVIEVENLQANPTESIRIIERNIIISSLAPQRPQYAGSLFGFSFDVELKGSGTAGTAPRIGRLLQACGMGETIVASTSVTYEPSSSVSTHASLTIFYKEGVNLRKVTGARGNASVNIDAGGRLMVSFTFIGHIASEAQAAAPSETAETTLPPVFIGATFQSGGFAVAIGKLAIDLGNTMSIAPDPNAADGYGVIRIGARKLAGSFDPEAQGITTKDFIGELRAATAFALQTGVLGGTAGNQVALSLPVCQFVNAGPGDREALLVYDMSYGAFPTSAGDDDIAIALT